MPLCSSQPIEKVNSREIVRTLILHWALRSASEAGTASHHSKYEQLRNQKTIIIGFRISDMGSSETTTMSPCDWRTVSGRVSMQQDLQTLFCKICHVCENSLHLLIPLVITLAYG